MLVLLLHSCGSGNNVIKKKQDQINNDKDINPQINVISKKEIVDSTFLSFWQEFINTVKNRNEKSFKEISFDSLKCEGKNVHINTFIKSYFSKVFDDTLTQRFSDINYVDFVDASMDSTFFPFDVLTQMKEGHYVVKEVNITKSDDSDGPVIFILKFIETKHGYKFYGYNRVG